VSSELFAEVPARIPFGGPENVVTRHIWSVQTGDRPAG
jgi:hypothetical protein